MQASVAAYIDAVIAGQEPPIAGAAAVETMRLLHRIYDSAVVLARRERATRPLVAASRSDAMRAAEGPARGNRPVTSVRCRAVIIGGRLPWPAVGIRRGMGHGGFERIVPGAGL